MANDATVKGGTYFPITVKKHLRAQSIAREKYCPVYTWLIRAAQVYLARRMSSLTVITLGAFSTTKLPCRRTEFPRLPL